jgi:hypothetical protein
MFAATITPHTCWLGHSNTNSIIGPDELLATIQVIESERQVMDRGWLLGTGVLELVQELVLARLHRTGASHTSTERAVESVGEPPASAAPPAVLGVCTSVGSSNCSHDQINLATTEVTHTGPPDGFQTLHRAKTTQIVRLQPVLLEVQDGCLSATESTEMFPVASHSHLRGDATFADRFSSTGDPTAAAFLDVSSLTMRRAFGATTSTELPTPSVTMFLESHSIACTILVAICLGLVQIFELLATTRASRAVSGVLLVAPLADFRFPVPYLGSSRIGVLCLIDFHVELHRLCAQ